MSIEIKNLSVEYNGYIALENVNFRIDHPSIMAVMGPNGAGKTTLLKAMIGLTKFKSGFIKIFGHNIPKDLDTIRGIVGYVPQQERIVTNIPMRAFDIVLLAKLVRRGPLSIVTKRDIKEVKEVLNSVLLPKESWFKKFSELSGGQKQKVLIARALISKPKLLLLDEPFSGVDVTSQREIMEILHGLKRDTSIIIVTHDVNPIIEYVDYIMLLNKRTIAFGKPTEVLTEENLSKAYGVKIRLIVDKDICYAIIGDYHA